MMKLTTLAAALFAAVTLCADDHNAKKEDCAKQESKPQKCCCCCCCHGLKGKTVKICPMPAAGTQNQQNQPGVMQITEGEMVIYAVPVNMQADASQTPAQNASAGAATAQNTPAPAPSH